MATKILKLTSGEDVIGDYEERDGKCFLGKAAKIVMYPTEQGGMNLAMLPWTPYSDDEEVEIRKEGIMALPMEPSTDVRNEYSRRFGTGVVDTTPTKSDIIV